MLVVCTRRAQADVIVNGSVSPGDNPFTIDTNEGLPFDGNGINFNVMPPYTAEQQEFFESLEDIIVGVSGPGDVTINNGSFLRYEHLTIGSSTTIGNPPNVTTLIGTGLFRIVGVGAYFNNNPELLPAGFPPYSEFSSLRAEDAEDSNGFDLVIGETGFGTMEIVSGARAEIQDAVIIGDQPVGDGFLLIDGLGSQLTSGGFSLDQPGDPPAELDPDMRSEHQLIIGRLGFGEMRITNGGRVSSNVGDDTQVEVPDYFVAAVIGSDPFDATEPIPLPPDKGGEGAVLVSGPLSRWSLQGSLQIGGFHNVDGTFGPDSESEGDNVIYTQGQGQGALTIADGALVTLLPLDTENDEQVLKVFIGRTGTLELQGGRINVGTNTGDVQALEGRSSNMEIVNDGVISGSGQITTGTFRNRFHGEIEIVTGERLVIAPQAIFEDVDDDAPPAINWGIIRVIGNHDFRAELEINREPDPSGLPAPFQNRQLTTLPATGRAAGLIHVQDGVLRFESGLDNQGSLAFTGGDNLVVGDITNLPGDGMDLRDGVITIDGLGTKVVVEGNLLNDGVLDIGGSTQSLQVLGEFDTSGTVQLELQLGLASRIDVVGDALLSGVLQVALLGISPSAGDAYGILAATGDLTGIFTGQVLPTLGTDLGWSVHYDYTLDTVTLLVLSTATVSGADFNGDGVVDGEDLAIWETNFGITSGATALQGDADGDGDVDGDDYDAWLMQISPGSGASNGGLANVPEPSSLAIACFAVAFGLIGRRRPAG
jgi:hypothetical protein